ncbi:DUF2249 domain-containing protein [Aurantimonas sp. C2-6-R+9]|uniref:DUF2249 domain-containing protein n=1 Tax=unclassified Aurantimonas TaxID=2638230 RepID=UPI002E17EC81|nr:MULTISPECIES: DUF2249 domain-containing protein [unclassified Aurantimonas]MEC5293506.1 DUF2249 domain-containing protein [Aurantimonas sp. C2-3-R2]MEC5383682.1 DUF2249 domain-containing protein [Aurantimonas sp. C2-6-R+9]MEC5414583.1 DUF2249 domain-containing protein [Aurantimonas sp. C2-4-R8]
MHEQALSNERVVDVREIGASVRHTVISQLFIHLAAGETLQLIVDHDPRRLKLQLEAGCDGGICWDYLEKGPDIWRVRLGRKASI